MGRRTTNDVLNQGVGINILTVTISLSVSVDVNLRDPIHEIHFDEHSYAAPRAAIHHSLLLLLEAEMGAMMVSSSGSKTQV